MAKFYGIAEYDEYDEVAICEEQWATVQKSGNIALQAEDREQVLFYLRTFVRRTRAPATETTLSTVQNLLSAFEGNVKKPQNTLYDMDPRNKPAELSNAAEVAQRAFRKALRQIIDGEGWKYGAPSMPSGNADAAGWQHDIAAAMNVWIRAARVAQDDLLASMKSELPNDELRDFLDRAAPIYARRGGAVTANKTLGIWSPFVRWINELMKCVPSSLCEPKSIDALGDVIRHWKPTRSSAT